MAHAKAPTTLRDAVIDVIEIFSLPGRSYGKVTSGANTTWVITKVSGPLNIPTYSLSCRRAASLHSLTDKASGLDGRSRLLSDCGSPGFGASEDAHRNTRRPRLYITDADARLRRRAERPSRTGPAECIVPASPADRHTRIVTRNTYE